MDSEIRKKYNVDELSLPPLPQIDSSENSSNSKEVEIEQKLNNVPIKDNLITIKKGKKLKVKSLSVISDKTAKGTKVSFTLLQPVTTTYFTIPANTVIYGKVIRSHMPQITGNGGLIAIRLTSVKINGKNFSTDGRVLKSNYKHIFFNNIKGQRKYLSSIPKSMKWGRNYKNKMYKTTKNLAKEKATMIFCPFSFLFGTLGYTGNAIFAPVLAIRYKGGRIILNKGTEFTFKLTEDIIIY